MVGLAEEGPLAVRIGMFHTISTIIWPVYCQIMVPMIEVLLAAYPHQIGMLFVAKTWHITYTLLTQLVIN
jgi:hypothetical protein